MEIGGQKERIEGQKMSDEYLCGTMCSNSSKGKREHEKQLCIQNI